MKEICKRELCTGCGACANSCNISCIVMAPNSEGFLYPEIDSTRCVDCNKCRTACPIVETPKVYDRIQPEALATINEDEQVLLNSASGGMFRAFADQWDGSVYGAYMREDYSVFIQKANNKDDLKKMQGSKYVYSNMNNTYQLIKKELTENIKVLFFGLPCQVAGLRKYLQKDYDNLVCVDIVCHGTPSTKLFQDYMSSLKKNYGNIKDISFTDKTKKWVPIIERITCIKTEDKTILRDYTQDTYMTMFINEWVYRESCYQCKFADIQRMGDITIGDFFGLGVINKYKGNTDHGVSQVLLNTKKGKIFFDSIKAIQSESRPLDECLLGNSNLWKASSCPSVRLHIYEEYNQYGYDYIVNKYCKNFSNSMGTKIKYLMRKHMPKTVARIMIKKKGRNVDLQEIHNKIRNL